MAKNQIQATKNYRMFHRNPSENRTLDIKKHGRLVKSMQKYGFLKCFPIVVVRDKDGRLVVRDGQHRLAIAESLGLTIYWVEEETDFDPAVTSSAGRGWVLKDHAEKWSLAGKKAYSDGMEFAKQHGLPIGTAFSLLAGTTVFNNIATKFLDGEFKVKDRRWADAVAGIYGPLVTMSPVLKSARFIEACMAVCRVAAFDSKRLIQNADRCREKLVSYGTRDAFLDMLEEIYNYGRKQLIGLKAEATMAMRERNPRHGKGGSEEDKAA